VQLSVIIPCFNAQNTLPECIGALLRAAIPGETQLVFVDDASTDKTAEILTENLRDVPDATIRHHTARRGVSASRNDGLNAATGEFVAFCDADDFVEKEIYRKLLNAITTADADAAVCAFYRGKKILHPLHAATGKEYIARQMPSIEFNSCWNKLYRRDIIKTHSLTFDEKFVTAEDLLFNVQYLLAAQRLAILDDALYHYEENPFSATARETPEKAKSSVAAAWEVDSLLADDCAFDQARCRLLTDALMTTLRADGFTIDDTRQLLAGLPANFWRDARFGTLKQSVLHLAAYAPRLTRCLVRKLKAKKNN